MGDGNDFEIPSHASRREPAADGDRAAGHTPADRHRRLDERVRRRGRHRLVLPAMVARAAVPRRGAADGAGATRTHASSRSAARATSRRFMGRHALKAGVDAVRLRPRESSGLRRQGYLEFTHLVGLPHIHVTGQSVAFAGTESGGQVSAYVQDSIQIGGRVTADVGLRVDRYDLLAAATHASPRVNLAFRVGGATVLHASYNHFFVPPPIEGVLSSSAGLTRSIEEIGVALPASHRRSKISSKRASRPSRGRVQLALTSYYRATDNPVHTTVWPDSRIYSYASFDRARAYGLEAKADVRSLRPSGLTGYSNYALGRVYFYNPVTGGFVTEAAHLTETNRFLAPMDQTHTLTGGVTYRHARQRRLAGEHDRVRERHAHGSWRTWP